MENLLKLPITTMVNKNVPKNAFYKNAPDGKHSLLQRLLTDEVENITWLYKLSAATLSLADSGSIKEIDIFVCSMKESRYNIEAIRLLDTCLPRPVLYLLRYEDKCDIVMWHKEKRSDGTVTQGDTEKKTGLNAAELQLRFEGQTLEKIYCCLLSQLSDMPIHSIEEYTLKTQLRKKIAALEKQVIALQKKVRAEKQFSKQIEMNKEAKELKKELEIIRNQLN